MSATKHGAIRARSGAWLYWTGCAANYDPRVAAIVTATARVLRAGGIKLEFLGQEEACTGDPARRLGEEGLFQQLALQNIETLKGRGVQRIVTHCAHCFHVLKNEYRRFGGEFEVVHHVELIASLFAEGRILSTRTASTAITLHDSCYVGRYNRVFDAPRAILRTLYGEAFAEMPRHGERSFCCGAGGANYWYDAAKRQPAGVLRVEEAARTGSRVVAAECPFCVKMLEQGAQQIAAAGPIQVQDIAEIVAAALDNGDATPAPDLAAPPGQTEKGARP